jgi:hypothetical protein
MRWEQEMYVLYGNQIGWFTYEREEDPGKLETALEVVEKGDKHSLLPAPACLTMCVNFLQERKWAKRAITMQAVARLT